MNILKKPGQSKFTVENLINKNGLTDHRQNQSIQEEHHQNHKNLSHSNDPSNCNQIYSSPENSIQFVELVAFLQSQFSRQECFKTSPIVDITSREATHVNQVPSIPTIFSNHTESTHATQSVCIETFQNNPYFQVWKNFVQNLKLVNIPTVSDYYQQILAAQLILAQQGGCNNLQVQPTQFPFAAAQFPLFPANINSALLQSAFLSQDCINSLKQTGGSMPSWPMMQIPQVPQTSPAYSSQSSCSTIPIPKSNLQNTSSGENGNDSRGNQTIRQTPTSPLASNQQEMNDGIKAQIQMPHQANKAVVCPVCGKSFNAQYNLARHAVIHSGARPFLCKVIIIFFF